MDAPFTNRASGFSRTHHTKIIGKVEPLAKLAIEDDLLAETAKMKKGPGPFWC
ncbi:MAG: hypothetical protein GY703_06860 [Gammaproteobacteria bacterium]|nr:hypothetical protein [Gammaproteobacteria bacterium]